MLPDVLLPKLCITPGHGFFTKTLLGPRCRERECLLLKRCCMVCMKINLVIEFPSLHDQQVILTLQLIYRKRQPRSCRLVFKDK